MEGLVSTDMPWFGMAEGQRGGERVGGERNGCRYRRSRGSGEVEERGIKIYFSVCRRSCMFVSGCVAKRR